MNAVDFAKPSLDFPVVEQRWHRDARIVCQHQRLVGFLGDPGIGKTLQATMLTRSLTGKDPIVLAGGSQIEQHHFYGRYGLCGGETRWIPGALIRAIEESRWLLIEDIHSIQFDARSPLLQLATVSTLTNPDTGDVYELPPASPDNLEFRLIATSNAESIRCARRPEEARALYSRFIFVEVDPPTPAEMKSFLVAKFPTASKARINRVLTIYGEYSEIKSNDESGQSNSPVLTFRAAEHLLKLLEAGLDEDSSIKHAIVSQFALDKDLHQTAKLKSSIA